MSTQQSNIFDRQTLEPEIMEDEIMEEIQQEVNTNYALINATRAEVMTIDKVQNQVDFLKNFRDILKTEFKMGIDIEIVNGNPMLSKAGSAKTQFYTNTYVEFETITSTANYETGFFEYKIKAKVKSKNNPDSILGEGIGTETTYDTKTYYTKIKEEDLYPYYLQFINFDKYVKKEFESLEKFKNDYSKILTAENLEKRVKIFEDNINRRLNRKYIDQITGKELELEDLEKTTNKSGDSFYKVPNKEINLSSFNHKTHEIACKRAEALALRRAFDIDDILKEIAKENKQNNTNNTDDGELRCTNCNKVLSEKELNFSKTTCYKCTLAQRGK